MSPSENRNSPPASSGDQAPPWSSLPLDLVRLVGWRVLAGDLLDYVRFRAVCTHWRSSTVRPHGHGVVDPRFHPRRWMILPEGHGVHPADGKKRFFNLSTGAFVRVSHPLLMGFHRVVDSVDGILLMGGDYEDDTMVWLLHPFTGDVVGFPPLMPVLQSHWKSRYRSVELKFVASLSVSADGTATVMIMHQHIPRVFFASTKDQQWSVSTWSLSPLSIPTSFQGKLYILEPPVTNSNRRRILQLDPPHYEHNLLMPPKLIATSPTTTTCCLMVECDLEILVVGYDKTQFPISNLVVYRLADLAIGKVVPITNIGGNTLFLDVKRSETFEVDGIHVAGSMSSSYKAMPTIERDTIITQYFGYPRQYDLRTGKWSLIMGRCVNHGQSAGARCNCSLIYHMWHSCHCAAKMVDWMAFRM